MSIFLLYGSEVFLTFKFSKIFLFSKFCCILIPSFKFGEFVELPLEEFIENINSNINYENWIYKITESGRLRKFYLVLVNKDTYYYKSDKKTDFVGMHNLSGCFVQESEKKTIEGAEYFSFEIFCKNKSRTRKYYTSSALICKQFIENIKKAIGYVKFSDLYEMKEVIGKGKFGVVN